MQQSGETGGKLAELIKKAIRDGEVSNDEYDQIMSLAEADHHIDAQERSLLRQLNDMIANGTVKRVAK